MSMVPKIMEKTKKREKSADLQKEGWKNDEKNKMNN